MSYTHLTSEERFSLELLLLAGLSLRKIARILGRHHTTISREIRRNTGTNGIYCSLTAQRSADRRRAQARHYRRQLHKPLVDYVAEKLKLDWSPEQIAGRLRLDFPDDKRMRCSPETIYRWVYLDAQQGGKVYRHLRRRHRRRRRQKRFGQGRRFFAGRVSIAERPEIVAQRLRVGDWEADLMLGKPGKGALVTYLERKSRYLCWPYGWLTNRPRRSIRPWKPSWPAFPGHCAVH
ncbi:helix-turn-helix protein [Geothermobacter ehrlichii]|uniref:Helix-turn-helix protein n=1 Tax=Geothermobacter ehrlichii TaxID=213224 RepID=A0A5D3WKH1_9BACT|nr:IS30 family transposase [Geothermobacter ehrlichii]TYO98426.1 helix-turn-helix protein [Geothermobacter ehrlichii]